MAKKPTNKKPRAAHIWVKEPNEHYVEPEMTSLRLFEEEPFTGAIHDMAAGLGRIVYMARKAGITATGSDLISRAKEFRKIDFRKLAGPVDNIVTNPPFSMTREFVEHGLKIARHKVAILFPIAQLCAAGWLDHLPLRRVWAISPRPSMPPVNVILAGVKPGGGRADHCWLVFERGYVGKPEFHRLPGCSEHAQRRAARKSKKAAAA
jgi:hypothetical protein